MAIDGKTTGSLGTSVPLETIADKVERLTVHNGTGGLLNDLVKLRDG